MPTGSCKTAALRESLKLVMARAARGGLAMTELLSDVDAWTGFADRFTSRICAPAARRQTSQRGWPQCSRTWRRRERRSGGPSRHQSRPGPRRTASANTAW